VAGAVGAARAQPGERERFPTLGLRFLVAEEGGGPVVADDWIAARVDWSNRIFGAHGVTFRTVATGPLAAAHTRLENRRDRHRLGALVEPHVVNCFVVASLRDVDNPEYFIRGVHWRSRSHAGRHYVILSMIAGETVLAHELGHFFGNRHSDVPGNIMSYLRGDGPPFFDEAQVRIVHRHVRRFLGSGELRPAPDPS
jgi:hypothetical protein